MSRSAESLSTPEEKQVHLEQLTKLAEMPDSEIDFSEIPEWTEEDFRRSVQGAHASKSAYRVTLYLEDKTATWLSFHARSESRLINFVLKQAVQHGRRALRERKEGSNRPIYDTASEIFNQGLELLSGRRVPELEYVEMPEYSDVELKSFGLERWPDMEAREMVLFVDEEVSHWLEENASTHALRINYAIRHVAERVESLRPNTILSKAS